MDGWNTTFLLGPGPFSGAFAVSSREKKAAPGVSSPTPLCQLPTLRVPAGNARSELPLIWLHYDPHDVSMGQVYMPT